MLSVSVCLNESVRACGRACAGAHVLACACVPMCDAGAFHYAGPVPAGGHGQLRPHVRAAVPAQLRQPGHGGQRVPHFRAGLSLSIPLSLSLSPERLAPRGLSLCVSVCLSVISFSQLQSLSVYLSFLSRSPLPLSLLCLSLFFSLPLSPPHSPLPPFSISHSPIPSSPSF